MSTWTADRVDALTKDWKDGLSASQIAKRLGGVTRNAVIGKVHRLGLMKPNGGVRHAMSAARSNRARMGTTRAQGAPGRTAGMASRVFGIALPDCGKNPGKSAERAAEGKALIAAVEANREVLSPNARPWEERGRGQCAWPLGETGAIRSCCNPVEDDGGRPYCDGHRRMMGGRPIDPKSLEKLEGWIRRMERPAKAA